MYCDRFSMSLSDSVPATLVMLPASLVRRRALKSASCLITYLGHCPATRGMSFWPTKSPRWHIGQRTASDHAGQREVLPDGTMTRVSGQPQRGVGADAALDRRAALLLADGLARIEQGRR